MKIALKLSLLLFAAAFVLDAQITPPPGGGGSVLACVGTPGNTFGAYRSLCMDSNKAVWVCGNALTCTIAADWANVGQSGVSGVASFNTRTGAVALALGDVTGVLTNYSTIAGLTGYPSTFPPTNSGDWAGTWQSHAPSYFQLALTNYSTISGLTGYPSTFPPTNSGNWAGTWQSNSPAAFQSALVNYSTISGLSGYPSTFPAAITLTTIGSSGAATWNGTTLNIPQYAGGGSMTWPSSAGIVTWASDTSWGSPATSSTIIGLFGSGSCSGYLKSDGTCATPGGGGTVTSVSFTGGLISVANGTSTPAFTVAGTSGGVPYFNSGTTWASSGALTQYGVVLGGGAGNAPTSTSASTTTTQALFATTTAPAFRAIATGDLPTIPLAGGGTGVDLSAAGGAVNTTGAQVLHENASHVISSSALIAADLPNTAVSPNSYTNTNLTVDAQGRITAASNGSGGSGYLVMTTGSGAPSAACAVPTSSNLAMYWDSVGLNIYYCSATTPTWQKFSTDGNGQGLSGSIEFMGTTSGGAGFAVSDVAAATQILYMLPTTNGTANQVLYDTGSATCGTYTTGSPALCHQLAWETAVASTNALASATTTVNVSSATAPTNGQVLTATGGTAATWQTPSGGTSVNVNGSSVSSPNFNGSTPAAQAGYQNAALQVSASSVSVEVPITYAVEQNSCGTGSYTLLAADNASVIQFSAVCTVTVPTGLGAGFNVIVEQTGSGTVTFTGSGTTLHQLYGSASTAGQWAKVALYSDTDTVWQLRGNLTGVLAAGNVSGLGSLATLSTATIATGGTNATSAASAGLVPNTSSTSASAWTATPTLGVAASATGSTTYANATGSGTFTVGASPSTTTNTLLGPTAVIANNHLIGCTTSTTTCTMTDVTPSASLVNLGSVTNDAQTKASVVPNTTAVGAIPDGTSTSAASWTITPTLGNPATTTGTLAFANATGSGTFTLGASPSTTSNTLLGPTAVPVTGHLLDVTVSGTVATLHDSGLATANIDTSTTTKPLAYGGTGVDLSAAGGAVNTTGAQVLHENAAHVISSSAIALVDLPTITVPYGGTGLATLTAHAVQVGEGTSTPAQVGPNAATTYPLFSAGASADPAFRAIAVGDLPVLHGQCTEAWGGSGTSFAMTSGDDAIVNNTCYNDSGATRTITAVKCRSNAASNTTVLTPTFGSAGTGTAILTGTVTCGNSYAYSSTGTISTSAWTTGTGIDPGMSTVGNATSIALLIEYTYQPY